jgi:hypothetical protein
LCLLPALGLATPTLANESVVQADFSRPGAVIVWPKFQTGSVNVFPGTAGQFSAAQTLIELGNTGGSAVTVHMEWVCPGQTVGELPSVCSATDFFVTVSANGKVTFNPSGTGNPTPSDYNESIGGEGGPIPVPPAPCPRGYLIGWVVAPASGNQNVLVGDAIIRSFGTDLQSYKGITIQAVSGSTSGSSLVFDGQPGHYAQLPDAIYGDVSYDSNVSAPFHNEALIFLSLDVNTNGTTTDPTIVPLDFYNYNELVYSIDAGYQFTCWGQVELSKGLDGFLTTEGMGTYGGTSRHDKGLVYAGPAFDGAIGPSVHRTLLGIIQTTEGPAPGAWSGTTSYETPFFNQPGETVSTKFNP